MTRVYSSGSFRRTREIKGRERERESVLKKLSCNIVLGVELNNKNSECELLMFPSISFSMRLCIFPLRSCRIWLNNSTLLWLYPVRLIPTAGRASSYKIADFILLCSDSFLAWHEHRILEMLHSVAPWRSIIMPIPHSILLNFVIKTRLLHMSPDRVTGEVKTKDPVSAKKPCVV